MERYKTKIDWTPEISRANYKSYQIISEVILKLASNKGNTDRVPVIRRGSPRIPKHTRKERGSSLFSPHHRALLWTGRNTEALQGGAYLLALTPKCHLLDNSPNYNTKNCQYTKLWNSRQESCHKDPVQSLGSLKIPSNEANWLYLTYTTVNGTPALSVEKDSVQELWKIKKSVSPYLQMNFSAMVLN